MNRALRIRELFDELADLAPDERESRLSQLETDETVKREVRELLRADASPLAMLNATPESLAEAAGATEPDLAHMLGKRIGPYEIVDVLGTGGMGTVFLAQRSDIGLHVALKLVRGALGDPTRAARFRQEAAVLARLNHPYIAQLIDVGAADDGTPYLAMGHVRGSPITAWCEQKRQSVEQRLRLFIELCQAVSFAHQHLVIHRDLKPSNVLVTPEGVVKLLDFGVAKLVDEAEANSVETITGVRLLSPEHASPEQILGDPISTGTDVHGLGLLLFELLTGARPYGAPEMKPTDLFKAVLQDEPRRPSALLQPRPRAVSDLDAICLKAIAKKPRDRYASVADLSDDVGRYLLGLPVHARLPTLRYRAGRFVGRHRLGVALTSVAVVALVISAGVATRRAQQAQRALAEAQQVSTFLLDVFRATDPAETRGADAPMKSFLELALVHLDELESQPAVQARLLLILSQAHVGLGDYAQAAELAERALVIQRAQPTTRDADLAAGLVALGIARFELGELDAAVAALRNGLAIERRSLGDANDATTETMMRLAEALARLGQSQEAEQLARDALANRLTVATRRDEPVADHVARLGKILSTIPDKELEAERLLRLSLQMREDLHGPDDFRLSRSLIPLGEFLANKGDQIEAESLSVRALALHRRIFGDNDPRTLAVLNLIAHSQLNRGNAVEARALFEQVIRGYSAAPQAEDPMLVVAARNVAATFWRERQYDSAQAHLADAIAMSLRVDGPESQQQAQLLQDLGLVQLETGRLPGAERSFREAHRQYARVLGGQHPLALRAGALHGLMVGRLGRRQESERLLREILFVQERVVAAPHPDLTQTISYLGEILTAEGKLQEALQYHTRALQLARTGMYSTDPARLQVLARLKANYRAMGRVDLANRVDQEEAGVATRSR